VGASRLAQKFIGRELKHAGHRGDGSADFFAGAHEQRQDELLHAQARLAYEAA
jgi:hypothetical protein